MERDNKEIQSHDGVMDNMGKFSESLLLRAKNRVVSTLERVTKPGSNPNLVSFDMKMALSNSPDKDLENSPDKDLESKRNETNESNEFGSSGGNKRQEEKASKGQEGRKINKNSWNSKDKTESGEYVLSRPPKKPGGEEAYDIDTAPSMTCATASTFENSSQKITDILENWKVPNIVRTKKEDNHSKTEVPMTFKEMAEDAIGLPHHEILFMTGKEIRDRGDRLVLDKYMRSKTTTDQNYVPRKRNIVKPAMKWRVPDQITSKSNTFSFNTKTTTPVSTRETNALFVFGADTQKLKESGTSRSSRNRDGAESSSKPGKRKHPRPRKINSYVIRDQELKIEESKQAQRKIVNWKTRQQQKLGRNIEVLNVSEFLRKKFLKKSKNKKRRINKEEQITTKVMKRPIRTTYMLEKEEPGMLCLEKRQQSSPAVMFARLRSNRRYKPGD